MAHRSTALPERVQINVIHIRHLSFYLRLAIFGRINETRL